MLTCSASQVCEAFTKWKRGLPFRGAKRLQSLLVSMEMLHVQLISEQLLYLRVPAPRYTPHRAAWLSEESNCTGKNPNLIFLLGGCKSKSLLPQDLTVLLSKSTFPPFTCSSISCGDAMKRLSLMER